jgi:ankyrin repeat protein
LQTALHLACSSGLTKLVRRLIVSGASLDLQDAAGRTALLLACETGDLMLVRQLLSPIHSKEIESADLKYKVNPHTQLKRLFSIRNYEGQFTLAF